VDETTSTTTTTTTYGTGTISEYTPGSTFVVKESSGSVKYKYGEERHLRDQEREDLDDDEVRTRINIGSPVRVQYGTEGDAKVISRGEIDD
jgi:hypothetical protein